MLCTKLRGFVLLFSFFLVFHFVIDYGAQIICDLDLFIPDNTYKTGGLLDNRVRWQARNASHDIRSDRPQNNHSGVFLTSRAHTNGGLNHREKNFFSASSVETQERITHDFTSPYETFYRDVNSHVMKTGEFPWHLVDKEDIFRDSGVLEYQQHCTNGSPFDPLPGYVNPCWMAYDPSDNPDVSGREESQGGSDTRLACMPRFYLAGFPKCGTTDLFESLALHPGIAPGLAKEIEYWTLHSSRGFHRYVEVFSEVANNMSQVLSRSDNKTVETITFDGTPSTIWRPSSPGSGRKEGRCCDYLKNIGVLRILALYPAAKIIVTIRNPIYRTISHYLHKHKMHTSKTMYNSVSSSVRRLQNCFNKYGVRRCAYTEHEERVQVLLRVGLYCVYIKDLLDLYPRDQIFIIKAEEYFSSRVRVMQEVFSFLQIAPMKSEALTQLRGKPIANKRSSSAPDISRTEGEVWKNKTIDLLHDFFTPFNIKLAELLDDPWFLRWNSAQR